MQNFQSFLEEQYLAESLISPVEFYMTDDTKMPQEIYAAFEINDTQYGCSLVRSKWNRVYLLDFYRVVNVKKRIWSFKTSRDIRPGLSTIIKFVEACMPFIKDKMDGIIVDIPGKKDSLKYQKFMQRVIGKTYIKTYRSVPVSKKTDKAGNYLFLVKKAVQPKDVFKTAAFHKHFEFDSQYKSEAISDEAFEDAEPYKIQKPTVSLRASKKYAFEKLEVELEAGDELIFMLDSATLAYNNNVKSVEKTINTNEKAKGHKNPYPNKDVKIVPEEIGLKFLTTSYSASLISKKIADFEKMHMSEDAKFIHVSLPHLMKPFTSPIIDDIDLSAPIFDQETIIYDGFDMKSFLKEVHPKIIKKFLEIVSTIGTVTYNTPGILLTDFGALDINRYLLKFLRANLAGIQYIKMSDSVKYYENVFGPLDPKVGALANYVENDKVEQEDDASYNKDYIINIRGNLLEEDDGIYVLDDLKQYRISFPYLLYSYVLTPAMVFSIKNTNDPIKYNTFFSNGIVEDNVKKLPKVIQTAIATQATQELFDKTTPNIRFIDQAEKDISNFKQKFESLFGKVQGSSSTKESFMVKELPLANEIVVNTPNFENTDKNTTAQNNFNEDPYVPDKAKEQPVLEMPEVKKFREQWPNMPDEVRQGIRKYTGSSYQSMNEDLRDIVKNKMDIKNADKIYNFQIDELSLYEEYTAGMLKAFKDYAPRLESPIWVFRNGRLPNLEELDVGNEIVDPGFMSASVNSHLSYGDKQIKLKIYLPAKSRVLPVFTEQESENAGEGEIILPPFSVLKIIKLERIEEFGKMYITAVYLGSAYQSYFENAIKGIPLFEQFYNRFMLDKLEEIPYIRYIDKRRKGILEMADRSKMTPAERKRHDEKRQKEREGDSFISAKDMKKISGQIKLGKLKIRS